MALEDYKNIVSISATVVTIIQFLSGSDICRTIIKLESTGDISGLPFVVGAFSTSMWLTYAFLLSDMAMMVTNFVGLTTQVIYLLIYITYCVSLGPWRAIKKQMMIFGVLFSAVGCYTLLDDNYEVVSRNIGLLCCLSSIIFCISPLASLREVFRMRSTALMPFPLILSMFFVGGSWCLYGVIIENSFIVYPNFLVFILAGFQLSLFLIFPRKIKDLSASKVSLLSSEAFPNNIKDPLNIEDSVIEQPPNVHHWVGQTVKYPQRS